MKKIFLTMVFVIMCMVINASVRLGTISGISEQWASDSYVEMSVVYANNVIGKPIMIIPADKLQTNDIVIVNKTKFNTYLKEAIDKCTEWENVAKENSIDRMVKSIKMYNKMHMTQLVGIDGDNHTAWNAALEFVWSYNDGTSKLCIRIIDPKDSFWNIDLELSLDQANKLFELTTPEVIKNAKEKGKNQDILFN